MIADIDTYRTIADSTGNGSSTSFIVISTTGIIVIAESDVTTSSQPSLETSERMDAPYLDAILDQVVELLEPPAFGPYIPFSNKSATLTPTRRPRQRSPPALTSLFRGYL